MDIAASLSGRYRTGSSIVFALARCLRIVVVVARSVLLRNGHLFCIYLDAARVKNRNRRYFFLNIVLPDGSEMRKNFASLTVLDARRDAVSLRSCEVIPIIHKGSKRMDDEGKVIEIYYYCAGGSTIISDRLKVILSMLNILLDIL